MVRLNKLVVALIAMLTLCGVEARADTFVIPNVQGVVFVNTSRDGGPPTLLRPAEFQLFGPGLSISAMSPFAFGGDPGNVEARDTCRIMNCGAGTVLGTNSSFSGTLAAQGARATVNGVTFEPIGLTGSLNFVSPPIVLPSSFDFHVTIPFTFSGEITSTSLFTSTLAGQGFATFLFFNTSLDSSNPHYLLHSIEYRFQPFAILMDIKPLTFPNSINPRSKGKIAVAILSTSSFDATTVDPATVLFGATGVEAGPVHSVTEDVDADGDMDLVLHFDTQETGIECGDTTAWLTASIFGGPKIAAADSIRTVGCN